MVMKIRDSALLLSSSNDLMNDILNDQKFEEIYRIATRCLKMDRAKVITIHQYSSWMEKSVFTNIPILFFDPHSTNSSLSDIEKRIQAMLLRRVSDKNGKIAFCAAMPIRVNGITRALFSVYKFTGENATVTFQEREVMLFQELAGLASEFIPKTFPAEEVLPAVHTLVTALGHMQNPIEVAQMVTKKVWTETSRLLTDLPPPAQNASPNWRSISGKFQKKLLDTHFSCLKSSSVSEKPEDFNTRMARVDKSIQELQEVFSTVHEIFEHVLVVNLLSSNMVTFQSQSQIVDIHELREKLSSIVKRLCSFFSLQCTSSEPVVTLDDSLPENAVFLYCPSLLWIAVYTLLLKHRRQCDTVHVSAQMLSYCVLKCHPFAPVSTSVASSPETTPPGSFSFEIPSQPLRQHSANLKSSLSSESHDDSTTFNLSCLSEDNIIYNVNNCNITDMSSFDHNEEAILNIQLSLSSSSFSSFSFPSTIIPTTPTTPCSKDWDYYSDMSQMLAELQVFSREQMPFCDCIKEESDEDTFDGNNVKICDISMIVPHAKDRLAFSPSAFYSYQFNHNNHTFNHNFSNTLVNDSFVHNHNHSHNHNHGHSSSVHCSRNQNPHNKAILHQSTKVKQTGVKSFSLDETTVENKTLFATSASTPNDNSLSAVTSFDSSSDNTTLLYC